VDRFRRPRPTEIGATDVDAADVPALAGRHREVVGKLPVVLVELGLEVL
jgi:hypothetical protein